jgi:hypothetical protein
MGLFDSGDKNPTEQKKTSTKKAKSTSKDEEAKAKVQELLKNTSVANLVTSPIVEETKNEFDVNEIKKEKSMGWMEQQVHDLTEQVELLENEILFYKNELAKANQNPNAGVQVVDNTMNPNLVALFRHFEKVYELGYTDAKLAHPESGNGVLDKFMQYFPELQNIRRYRYRGTGM